MEVFLFFQVFFLWSSKMMQDVTKTCQESWQEAVINESTKNKKYPKNFEMYIIQCFY